jgi:tRNA threonylcarbamoyladenosine dehydratase
MTDNFNERFIRISMLLGVEALGIMKRASITIVGLGAVGSFALEAIARSGVGPLRLVDFDVVKPSNTNRQILALSENLGKMKTDIAKARVHSINPDCEVECFETFFDPAGFARVFERPTDIVVDAIDSLNPKIALLALCCSHDIPVVSSMGAARKLDPSMVLAGDISEASVDKLALRVRKRLRKEGIYCGIRCVYSIEELRSVSRGIDHQHEEIYKRGRERVPFGSMVFVPAAFGIRAAYEAFQFLINGKKFED